jgi:hypothetical protein
MTPARLPPWPTTPVACGPVVLREFSARDVLMVMELSTDPYVPLIGSLPAHAGQQQAQDWIDRQHGRLVDGAGYSFAIAEAYTDRAVGDIVLGLAHLAHGRATIGYSVTPSARGRGIAAAALIVSPRLRGASRGCTASSFTSSRGTSLRSEPPSGPGMSERGCCGATRKSAAGAGTCCCTPSSETGRQPKRSAQVSLAACGLAWGAIADDRMARCCVPDERS